MEGADQGFSSSVTDRHGLEARLRQRTARLVEANRVLKKQIEEHKRDKEELRRAEQRFRALSLELLRGQEQERKRIACELHDGIGASLSAIKFNVENILGTLESGASEAGVDMMRGLVAKIREAIEEVRKIAMDLRPSTLDDLGILATIDRLCREFQSVYPHIEIMKRIDVKENDIADVLKIVVYRVAQEALNNVAKHASASEVYVDLVATMDEITLRISDNGRGFDLTKHSHRKNDYQGMGLQSLKERAELSGGRFSVASKLFTGTVITVSWPQRGSANH